MLGAIAFEAVRVNAQSVAIAFFVSIGSLLLALAAASENADHLPRIGTGHEAAPIVGVRKAACVQVVNGCFYPGGGANQQDAICSCPGAKGR